MIRGQTKYTTQELRLRYKNSLVKHIPNERAEMRNQKGPSPPSLAFSQITLFLVKFLILNFAALSFCSKESF